MPLSDVFVVALVARGALGRDGNGCVLGATRMVLVVDGERRTSSVGARLEVDGGFLLHSPLSACRADPTRHIPIGSE